jgi:hypothetical protein
MRRIGIGADLASLVADRVNRTGVDDALDAMTARRLVDVVTALDRAFENLGPGSLHRGGAEMHDGVAALDHFHHRVEITQFAGHDFLMCFRRRHFAPVGKPQGSRQRRQAATQFASEVARGAGN